MTNNNEFVNFRKMIRQFVERVLHSVIHVTQPGAVIGNAETF